MNLSTGVRAAKPAKSASENRRQFRRTHFTLVLLILLSGTSALSQTWTAVPSMRSARYAHTATLLPTGEVLVAGGGVLNSGNAGIFRAVHDSTEVFGHEGVWNQGPRMTTPRIGHTATSLPDGRVLVVGGGVIASAEIYSPIERRWTAVANPNVDRHFHTATLLRDGKVLVAGGSLDPRVEVFNPLDGTWTLLPGAGIGRTLHTATLLPSGSILLAGGIADPANAKRVIESDVLLSLLPTTDLLDPATGQVLAGPTLDQPRVGHAAVLLYDQRLLILGGTPVDPQAAEFLDATSLPGEVWSPSPVNRQLSFAGSLLLPSGKVLTAGGDRATLGLWEEPGLETEIYIPDVAGDTSIRLPNAGSPEPGRTPTLTLLPSGKALLAGGLWGSTDTDQITATSALTWIFDPEEGWNETSWLNGAILPAFDRIDHTNTLLSSGNVLVASDGDAEIVVPVGGSPQALPAGQLNAPRRGHTATLLPEPSATGESRVLVAGGEFNATPVLEVETFEGQSSAIPWNLSGSLLVPRVHHTATLLPSGELLLAGGAGDGSAEIFDPLSGTSRAVGSMTFPRSRHEALLLPSGKVLVIGGSNAFETEIFDPDGLDPVTGSPGTWQLAPPVRAPRISSPFFAGLLPSQEPLIAAGTPEGTTTAQSEIFTSKNGWIPAGDFGPLRSRLAPGGAILPNGTAFVSEGGDILYGLMPDVFFDVQTLSWKDAQNHGLLPGQNSFEMTVMPNDWLLRTGGCTDLPLPYSSCSSAPILQFRDLGSVPRAATAPDIVSIGGVTSPPFPALGYDQPFTVEIARPPVEHEAAGGGTSASTANLPLLQLRNVESGQSNWLIPQSVSYDQDPRVYTFDHLPVEFEPGWYELSATAQGVVSERKMVNFRCSLELTALDAGGQPTSQDQTIVTTIGSRATFGASTEGVNQLQWQTCTTGTCAPQDWLDIPGANGSTFQTSAIQASDNGVRFRVNARSACTFASSTTWTIETSSVLFGDTFESGDLSAWDFLKP